ncbi:hypothetical protein MYX07_00450 [Patescibacteria group bacterium AH-259-L07]|nr:hypothetical protein [Patescibacteria group bacterium AH-259-L07]
MKRVLKIVKQYRKIGDSLLEAYIKDRAEEGHSLADIKEELKKAKIDFSRTHIWRFVNKKK